MTNMSIMFLPEEPKRDKRRAFTRTQKNEIWAQQDGRCASAACGHSKLDPRTVEYDHKKGWAAKGKTKIKNGRALCANCHKLETHKKRLITVEKRPKKKKTGTIFDLEVPKLKRTKGGISLF